LRQKQKQGGFGGYRRESSSRTKKENVKKQRKKGGCCFSSHRCLEPLSVSHTTTSHRQLSYQSPFVLGNTLLLLLLFMVCLLACRTCTVHVSTSRNIINWLLYGCFGLDYQPNPCGWAESSKKKWKEFVLGQSRNSFLVGSLRPSVFLGWSWPISFKARLSLIRLGLAHIIRLGLNPSHYYNI